MACINPDGSLTPSGRRMLIALPGPEGPEPMTIDALSTKAGVPLYRARASIREFLGRALSRKNCSCTGARPPRKTCSRGRPHTIWRRYRR